MSPPAKKATPRKTTAQQSGAARKAAAPGATKAAAKVTKVTKAAKAAKEEGSEGSEGSEGNEGNEGKEINTTEVGDVIGEEGTVGRQVSAIEGGCSDRRPLGFSPLGGPHYRRRIRNRQSDGAGVG